MNRRPTLGEGLVAVAALVWPFVVVWLIEAHDYLAGAGL